MDLPGNEPPEFDDWGRSSLFSDGDDWLFAIGITLAGISAAVICGVAIGYLALAVTGK